MLYDKDLISKFNFKYILQVSAENISGTTKSINRNEMVKKAPKKRKKHGNKIVTHRQYTRLRNIDKRENGNCMTQGREIMIFNGTKICSAKACEERKSITKNGTIMKKLKILENCVNKRGSNRARKKSNIWYRQQKI